MSREGTHLGGPLSDEQRKRRRSKNAACASRTGQAKRPGCWDIAYQREKDMGIRQPSGCSHRKHSRATGHGKRR